MLPAEVLGFQHYGTKKLKTLDLAFQSARSLIIFILQKLSNLAKAWNLDQNYNGSFSLEVFDVTHNWINKQ